jgi:curved DNA-binding protein CbpA
MTLRIRQSTARKVVGVIVPKLYASRSYSALYEQERTLYEILGVERDVSTEAIKKAFILRAKKLHPDTQQHQNTKADIDRDAFVRLVTAREILGCQNRRAIYDLELGIGRTGA